MSIAIESVNAQLRKIIKTRGQFPTDEAAQSCCSWRSEASPSNASLTRDADKTCARVMSIAIESVNAQLRKIIKTRGQFPTDEAALKLL
ncbi:hypothetical protein [Allopusillimonas ginsengisoli]|uniref:hypothetical protein n=1 Tax=Allopusillimonas ginsengisoli TaxID=453575 RepID=UPI0014316FE0|nr:hypothetical protein [Allopusillimonas ginsengisoli]